MKIAVVGGGGREHAIGWRIKRDMPDANLFFIPGNGGTALLGQNIPANPENPDEVVKVCTENRIDFVVVGPENPLARGVVDKLAENSIPAFGPNRQGAMIEASKVFAKRVMEEAGIPTARFRVITTENWRKEAENIKPPVVIKAEGLCAGKGSYVCKTEEDVRKALDDIFVKRKFGDEGKRAVVEEFLDGWEVSYFALFSQNRFVSLGFARDYKRLLDGDEGPNTGGMGAYCPVPHAEKLLSRVEEKIVKPLSAWFERNGIKYTGVLYAGLMVVGDEPYVLEFNVRFGDPEAQVLLPLLSFNLTQAMLDAVEGKLPEIRGKTVEGCAVGVVVASGGYPEKYEKGFEIELPAPEEDTVIFHAGTRLDNGVFKTAGGRVLCVVGLGDSFASARERAYNLVSKVRFKNMHYRKDIALEVVG